MIWTLTNILCVEFLYLVGHKTQFDLLSNEVIICSIIMVRFPFHADLPAIRSPLTNPPFYARYLLSHPPAFLPTHLLSLLSAPQRLPNKTRKNCDDGR